MPQKEFFIKRSDLDKWLDGLARKKVLLAPTRNEFDDVLFLPVKGAHDICFDYENTINSPKEYFLPDSETIFAFNDASKEDIKLTKNAPDIVLFGARSCDAKAIELLDKFFARTFEDNFYLERRRKTVIISVGCPMLYEDCFCTATRTGPFLKDGFDIQLVPINGGYIAKAGTEKGEALIKLHERYFKEPSVIQKKNAAKVIDKTTAEAPRFDLEKVYANLKSKTLSGELWEDIAQRCQSCGLCLFICPTCGCFTVNDRTTPTGQNRRMRQWDACYFRGFTRLAGGIDPIGTNEEMVKRKYLHKMWQQIDEFGIPGCTGCGRCNKACVGDVNWLQNLVRIEKA